MPRPPQRAATHSFRAPTTPASKARGHRGSSVARITTVAVALTTLACAATPPPAPIESHVHGLHPGLTCARDPSTGHYDGRDPGGRRVVSRGLPMGALEPYVADLACPASLLEMRLLDDGRVRVWGCGREAIYRTTFSCTAARCGWTTTTESFGELASEHPPGK